MNIRTLPRLSLLTSLPTSHPLAFSARLLYDVINSLIHGKPLSLQSTSLSTALYIH